MTVGMTGSVNPGRRERKKQQVRDELTRQAFELFTADGFDAVSVEDITEAADVSRATFFRYFPSKEDVLVQWMRHVGDEAAQALLERPHDEPPLTALRQALLTLADVYAQDKQRTALVEQLRRDNATVRAAYREKIAYWEDALAGALARRARLDADTDLTPRLLARLAMAAVTSANDTWSARTARGLPSDVTDLLDQAFTAIQAPNRSS